MSTPGEDSGTDPREEMASAIGVGFASATRFAQECAACEDKELSCDLIFLAGPLTMLQGSNYISFVTFHIFPSRTRTAFYCRGPLQCYLAQLSTSPALLCTTRDNHFRFLFVLLEVTEDSAIMSVACALGSPLCTVVDDVHFVHDMCALLCRLVRNDHARACLLESDLFRGLAKHFRLRPSDPSVVDVVRQGCLETHPDLHLLFSVVHECVAFIDRHGLSPRGRTALQLLENCSRVAAWRPHLVDPLVRFAQRMGWEMVLGDFLCNMLNDASVELVVKLHGALLLDSLIASSFAFAKGRAEWRAVRGLLRTQWPARVRAMHPVDVDPAPVIKPLSGSEDAHYECPITLEACVHPVVASDGRVYERDAIMQHLTTNGMISPFTKQPLAYTLYALFC